MKEIRDGGFDPDATRSGRFLGGPSATPVVQRKYMEPQPKKMQRVDKPFPVHVKAEEDLSVHEISSQSESSEKSSGTDESSQQSDGEAATALKVWEELASAGGRRPSKVGSEELFLFHTKRHTLHKSNINDKYKTACGRDITCMFEETLEPMFEFPRCKLCFGTN